MSVKGVAIAAGAIVLIGGGIGLADMMARKGRVQMERPAPPDISSVLKPRQGDTPPAKPEAPVTAEQPAVQPDRTAEQPANAAGGGESAAQGAAAAAEAKPMPEGHITIEQASALYDQQAFFVDARRKEVYVEGHVAGAFRADMASFRDSTPPWVTGLPKDMLMVVYCNGGDCDESEHVAQLLNGSGFTAVYIMHDGFPGWKAAGLPVETGEGQE